MTLSANGAPSRHTLGKSAASPRISPRTCENDCPARAATIAFVRALPDGAGERLGVSGLFGPMTLRQYATHVADHDVEHLAQIARARAAALGR